MRIRLTGSLHMAPIVVSMTMLGRLVMREWIWPLAPVIAVAYFVFFPHQFGEFVNWAGNFVN